MSSSNKLTLYTFGTPNGVAVSILLEELKVCLSNWRTYTSISVTDAAIGCLWRTRLRVGYWGATPRVLAWISYLLYRAISMSIRDADIGKVHNQVKSPWFLEVGSRLQNHLIVPTFDFVDKSKRAYSSNPTWRVQCLRDISNPPVSCAAIWQWAQILPQSCYGPEWL